MPFDEFEYCDSAYGGIYNRSKPVRFISKYVESLTSEAPKDSFLGAFLFNGDLVKFIETTGSIKGFSGKHWSYSLPIDVDRKDLEDARRATIAIVDHLAKEYDIDKDALHIFFSGNKGFHVLVPHIMFHPEPHEYLARIFRMFCSRLFGDIADMKIYEPLRLFRVPNSLHSSSDLYKIPITYGELLTSVTDIMTLAQNTRFNFTWPKGKPNLKLNEVYKETVEELKALQNKSSVRASTGGPSPDRPKDRVKMCYIRLLQGVGEGSRNDSAVRLASYFRKQGYPITAARALLIDWDTKNDPSFASEGATDNLLRTIESAYNNECIDYGCNDVILSSVCGSDCFMYSKKLRGVLNPDEEDALSIQTMEDGALAYIKRTRMNEGVKFGIQEFDDTTRGIMPGQVMQYVACQGGGKTAFALHLMHELSKQGRYCLFLSLEMPIEDVFERQAQMAGAAKATDVSHFIDELVKAGVADEDIAKQAISRYSLSTFNRVLTSDESSMTVEEIESITAAVQKKWDLSCVLIDYMGRINAFGNSYEKVSYIAKELKSMAKRLHIPVVYLNQTNRSIRTVKDMPTSRDSRDSGQAEEAADFIIASSRPNIDNTADPNKFEVRFLKNRRGREDVTINLTFIPELMRFTRSGGTSRIQMNNDKYGEKYGNGNKYREIGF